MIPFANIAVGINQSTTLSTTAATVVAVNSSRFGLLIRNDSAIDIWVRLGGVATAAAGGGNIKIVAGSEWRLPDTWRYTGTVSAIATSGTPAVTIFEW